MNHKPNTQNTHESGSEIPRPGAEGEPQDHWLKRLLDNPWWLLILGVLIPFLSYTVWGWIELALVTEAKLP
jgi:hypothetical protein